MNYFRLTDIKPRDKIPKKFYGEYQMKIVLNIIAVLAAIVLAVLVGQYLVYSNVLHPVALPSFMVMVVMLSIALLMWNISPFSNFINSVFNKYTDFKGRSVRSEYWSFFVVNSFFSNFLSMFPLGATTSTTDQLLSNSASGMYSDSASGAMFWLMIMVLYQICVLCPSLALSVRRLHDVGKSGGWWFINLIPVIGSFCFLSMMLKDGQPGPNQWGPDPKGRNKPASRESGAS